MLLLSLLLSVLLLCNYVYLFFNQHRGLNIISFFISLMTGFVVLLLHLITLTFPLDLAIASLLGAVLLLFKHRVILQWKSARMFFIRICALTLAISFFAIAMNLLSHIPVIFMNALFLWIGWIAVSTLFAFVHYLSWSSAYSMITLPGPIDVIIVLGAGLYREQVTQMLAWRLDRAVALYQHQKGEPYFIVSGGTGKGERVSEAEAMRDYLINQHVPSERILLEDQSHSTYENLRFSKDILQQQSFKHIAIVTSQFHILRALRFAQILKIKAVGIGSRTPYPFFDTALIRDFLGLMYCYKLLLTLYFGALFIASMLLKHPMLLHFLHLR